MKKIWYVYIIKFYPALIKLWDLSFVTTWMELEEAELIWSTNTMDDKWGTGTKKDKWEQMHGLILKSFGYWRGRREANDKDKDNGLNCGGEL